MKRIGGREIKQYEGLRNKDELLQWLSPIHFRYLLTDVHDLPDVTFSEITLDVAPDKKVQQVLEGGWEALVTGKARMDEHIMSAKQQSEISKVEEAIKVLKGMLESEQGPLICFSDHIIPAQRIAAALGDEYRTAVITGGTPMVARDEIVRHFQDGNIDLLCGTIGAMGTGITLTRASTVLFVGLSWVPANNEQAVGRIRRISQKNCCRVISMVSEGFDQKIQKLLLRKDRIISEVFQA